MDMGPQLLVMTASMFALVTIVGYCYYCLYSKFRRKGIH